MHQIAKKPAQKPVSESPRKPAYSSIEEADEAEIAEVLNQVKRPRGVLQQKLATLENGKGLKLDGNFERIRATVGLYNSKQKKKNGTHFRTILERESGKVFVVRDK
jgi:hypothetical protein